MTRPSGKSVLFVSEFGVRTGPRLTDYRVMQPGEVLELTDELRAYNTTSGTSIFDYTPEQQAREYGRVLCRVGDFPEMPSADPRAARWYAPLGEPRYAEPDSTMPVTSTTLKTYSHPNDRRIGGRGEP